MKSVNRKEVLKIFLVIIPASLIISLLIYVYGDLLIKNLPMLVNLIAINFNQKTIPQQNISNSYSRNVFSFNSNQTVHHSNLTHDYSIIVKQQIYLKVI